MTIVNHLDTHATDVRKRFCKCVYALQRSLPGGAAYAICTKSVYGTKGLKRQGQGLVACNLEKRTVSFLRDLAKRRGIPITTPIAKSSSSSSSGGGGGKTTTTKKRKKSRTLRKSELIRSIVSNKIKRGQNRRQPGAAVRETY